MEIEYKTFKEDCKYIIEPVVEKYGFYPFSEISEKYINYYSNGKIIIQLSMLENYPHIGVSLWFYPLNLKFVRPSLVDEKLGVSKIEKANLYKVFKSNFDLNNYPNQMRYAIEVMNKFYQPIITGDVRLEDIMGEEGAY